MSRSALKRMQQRERDKLRGILKAVNGGESWRRSLAEERKELASFRARWRQPRFFRAHKVELKGARVGAPSARELGRLVDSWGQAGRDLKRWSDTNWELYVAVARALRTFVYDLVIVPKGASFLGPIGVPHLDPKLSSGFRFAAWQFAGLATSPLSNDIGKCDRCGDYYLNTSGHRNKRYCKRYCSRLGSALKATQERRRKEHHDKLRRVCAVLRDFVPGKQTDLRQWIAERAGVTKTWLTRAVNRGELRLPGFLVSVRAHRTIRSGRRKGLRFA